MEPRRVMLKMEKGLEDSCRSTSIWQLHWGDRHNLKNLFEKKKIISKWQKIDDCSADAEGNVTKADEINQIQEGQSVDVSFGIAADEERMLSRTLQMQLTQQTTW